MKNDKTNDKLINIKEAALMLSLSASTLYQWVSAGKIPHVKLSARAVRFRLSQIDGIIDKNTVDVNDSPPSPQPPRQKRTKKIFKNCNNNKYLNDLLARAKTDVLNNK